MVKIWILLIVYIGAYANVFETNCSKCHTQYEYKLFMSKYTLKYSSKNKIKQAIFDFLKAPTSHQSIMPYEFIKHSGFKNKTILDDKNLHKAIDIYYDKYNLKNFIR